MSTFLIAWQESHHNISITCGRTTSSFINVRTSTRDRRISNPTRNLVNHTFFELNFIAWSFPYEKIVHSRSLTFPLVVVPAADFPNWSKATIPIVSWLFSPIWNFTWFQLARSMDQSDFSFHQSQSEIIWNRALSLFSTSFDEIGFSIGFFRSKTRVWHNWSFWAARRALINNHDTIPDMVHILILDLVWR